VDVLALDSGNVYKNLALSPLGRSGDPILMLAIAGPKEGSPLAWTHRYLREDRQGLEASKRRTFELGGPAAPNNPRGLCSKSVES
jgi:hypothetical protein